MAKRKRPIEDSMGRALAGIRGLLNDEELIISRYNFEALLVFTVKGRSNWIMTTNYGDSPTCQPLLEKYLAVRSGDEHRDTWPVNNQSEADEMKILLEEISKHLEKKLSKVHGGYFALLMFTEDQKLGPYLANGDRGSFVKVFTEMVLRESTGIDSTNKIID